MANEYQILKDAADEEELKQKLIAQAKKERAERLAAEAKKKASLPIIKHYYDVKVECMLPATLTYRILAEDPQQAAELIKGKHPNSVQHKLVGRKELVLRVYDASSSMMRFMKKLIGH